MKLNTNDVVILFGSYAKGKETEKSDIDLLIINQDGKNPFRSQSTKYCLGEKLIPGVCDAQKSLNRCLKIKMRTWVKQALKKSYYPQ